MEETMTPKKETPPSGNGHTLATLVQKVSDMNDRLDEVEIDVKSLLIDKSKWWKTVIPIAISLAILAGGWIWGLSGQSKDIEDLKAGRYENKGNIQSLQSQLTEMSIQDARRDEQYKQILVKLDEIQAQLKKQAR